MTRIFCDKCAKDITFTTHRLDLEWHEVDQRDSSATYNLCTECSNAIASLINKAISEFDVKAVVVKPPEKN